MSRPFPFLLLSALLFLMTQLPSSQAQQQESAVGVAGVGLTVPKVITLRAGVLHAPPFASVEERPDGSFVYGGFEPELLERLQIFAQQDNVTLQLELSPSPPQYGAALDLVANDCNSTLNENDLEDCQQFDAIIGDYYCNPARSVRVDFTPSWLRTTMSTIKYIDKKAGSPDYTTLTQAQQAGATVCVPDGTYLMTVVMAKFPKAQYKKCSSPQECLDWLQTEQCVLYADDELLLRYRQAVDPSLEVTREQFNTQYLVWPLSYNLPTVTSLLIKKWIYAAVSNATLDELYFKYFQKELCPVGTAGDNCELPCDPNHGTSDARGVCVCESIRWTGEDCSIEVEENVNLIPPSLKYIAYGMFGLNVIVITGCGIWLIWQRNSAQVRVSQPSFLLLVLLGCLISTSTILAMSQEDDGEGPVPACMAIPWLYSVGFSITFGTLFAKIRRVYLIFMKAAQAKSGISSTNGGANRKNRVTFRETLSVIGIVLVVDLFILITWTVVDPLVWQRTIKTADQFGVPLESEGHCVSEHWEIFAGLIAALHLVLLAVACWMCYVARDIPTKFSEGKYLAIAMISNLQIFVVGVPILIILGPDPQTSFFVRSVIIWMNDLAVVTLIFGNLIYSVHFEAGDSNVKVKAAVDQAISRYSQNPRNHEKLSSGEKQQTSSTFHATHSQAMNGSRSQVSSQITPSTHNNNHDSATGSSGRRRSSVFRNSGHAARLVTPSEVSWGAMNESVQEENSEMLLLEESFADEDSSLTEADEDHVAPLQQQQQPSQPTVVREDVLKNNRTSWGGVNFSTFSTGHSQRGAFASTTSDVDNDGNDDDDNDHDDNRTQQQKSVGTRSSGSNDRASKASLLAPASLPKNRPGHMSYAESRISRIRGEHAQYVAARKSLKNGGT